MGLISVLADVVANLAIPEASRVGRILLNNENTLEEFIEPLDYLCRARMLMVADRVLDMRNPVDSNFDP